MSFIPKPSSTTIHTTLGTLNIGSGTGNSNVIGVAGGMPVYGSTTSISPIMLCATSSMRFRAGEEQRGSHYTVQMPIHANGAHGEAQINAIYWDVGVVPDENPINELVRAFEDGPDDIHTDPMGILGAAMWSGSVGGSVFGSQVPLSFGMPTGALPKTQWCRAGTKLPVPYGVPAGRVLTINLAFTRGWAPKREVNLTFTLELS